MTTNHPMSKKVDALCCVCGTLRQVSEHYRHPRDGVLSNDLSRPHDGRRYLGHRTCKTCRGLTVHALLLPDGWRDYAEEANRSVDAARGAR